MEREKYEKLKKYYKTNFIGPFELCMISEKIGISNPIDGTLQIPKIQFTNEELIEKSNTHLLILFVPNFIDNSELTICKLRNYLGVNPLQTEPCFYNQDWYLKEKFANEAIDKIGWYLIKKEMRDESRGLIPTELQIKSLNSALILSYVFFATYFYTNRILWENDFIWTSDQDSNSDLIYVGRYLDPLGISKNGFSIHRHLSITKHYGQL